MASSKHSHGRSIQKRLPTSKSSIDHTKIKKPRRYKPGTVALREIYHQRKNKDNVIPKAVANRSLRTIIGTVSEDLGYTNVFRCTSQAKAIIRECIQKFCTDVLIGSNAVVLEKGLQTVDCKSIKMAFTNNNIPSRMTCPSFCRQDFETKQTNSICDKVSSCNVFF